MWGATYLVSSGLQLLVLVSITISAYCIGWLIGSLNEQRRLEELEKDADKQRAAQESFDYNHLRRVVKRKPLKIYYYN